MHYVPEQRHLTTLLTSRSAIVRTLALIMVLLPGISQAVDYHVGFGLGPATYDTGTRAFDDGSLNNTGSVDTRSIGATVYGESKLSPYLRVEYGLFDGQGGSYKGTSDGSGSYYWAGDVKGDYLLGGFRGGVVGTLPLGDKANLFLKGGLTLWFLFVTAEDSLSKEMDMDSGIAPYFGFGAEFNTSDLISLRIQYEQFSAAASNPFTNKDLDIDFHLVSLGLMFRF